jgi:SAM-dependent methyltransferase
MEIHMEIKGIKTEIIDTCILCRDSEIVDDPAFAHLLALPSPFAVKSCVQCQLRWLSPRPTRDSYIELYTNEKYFGGGDAPECYEELAKERTTYFKRRIEQIEQVLSNRELSILDVGAATGEFVREALNRGHSAEGIEISGVARKTAKEHYGIDLLNVGLDEIQYVDKYDVIHMNHVFEHLPYPDKSLIDCWRLLRPNGCLVLEVPQQFYNDLDRLKRVLLIGKQAQFTSYSLHHTYFFSPRSLSNLLRVSGFSVEKLRTANPDRTPFGPPRLKNLLLRGFLSLSDKIHRGGNIIETYARKTARVC